MEAPSPPGDNVVPSHSVHVPHPPGASRIEKLPRELIYKVLLESRNYFLPSVSKSLDLTFSKELIPAKIKALWLYDLWAQARKSSPYDPYGRPQLRLKRTTFILRHPFSHSVGVLTHLRRLLCVTTDDMIDTLENGLIHPSRYLKSGGKLPTDAIHHLYHMEVCDPDNMAAALYFAIDRGDRRTAEALFQCGADPRKLCDLRSAVGQKWAVKRLLEWRVEEMTSKRCKCGWEGKDLRKARPEASMSDGSRSASPDTLSSYSSVILPKTIKTSDMLLAYHLEIPLEALLALQSSLPASFHRCICPISKHLPGCDAMYLESRVRVPVVPSNGTFAHHQVKADSARIMISSHDRQLAVISGGNGVEKLIEKAWRAQQRQKQEATPITEEGTPAGEGHMTTTTEDKALSEGDVVRFIKELVKLGGTA